MIFSLLSFASVMRSIWGVVLAIIILLAMITIHEFGHYIAGRILRFKITEFSIGFGPALFKKRSKKTGELFALRLIPLGGYCAFDGEDDFGETEENKTQAEENPFPDMQETAVDGAETALEENPENLQNEGGRDETKQEFVYPEPQGERFNDQKPWKRIIVLLAGATMNYLLALVLLIIMTACYGVPMCISLPVGYNGEPLKAAEWSEKTLSACDVILEINGEDISMYTDCMEALEGKTAGTELPVLILRLTKENGEEVWKEKQVTLTLLADANFEHSADMKALENVMGVGIGTQPIERGFFGTIGGAFAYSGDMATSVLRTLGELVTGAFGAETVDVVGGPISMIGQTAEVATASPFSFLYIASFIGVNLAVFNLLPIPALDGCKVIFCLIEWMRKKPVNRKVEAIINLVGILFLFGFVILIDLLKIF